MSTLLLVCMLVNNLPVAALAEEAQLQSETEGAEITHAADCAYRAAVAGSACGHKHSTACFAIQTCDHTGGTATCAEQAVCDICGKGYGETLAHTFGANGKCACGAECEHTYAEGACTVCTMAEPEPVCGCTVKCAETASETCAVCKADLTKCIGGEPEPEAPAVITVSEWEWVDDEEIYNTERKVLELAGVGPWEDVKAMLPAGIRLADGTVVAVTWTCENFAAASGTYTLTATLPEGYALADGSNTLSLTLEMGVDSAAFPVYNLWVGGVQVTDENKDNITEAITDAGGTASGSATYDPITGTLTLNGFSYTNNGHNVYAIKSSEALNIVLKGRNILTCTRDYYEGIFCLNALVISQGTDGELTINTKYDGIAAGSVTIDSTTVTINSENCGIYTIGSVAISDSMVNVNSVVAGIETCNLKVTIENSTVCIYAAEYYAMNCAPTLTGDLEVYAGESAEVASKVDSPTAVTYNESNYVKIAPPPAPKPAAPAVSYGTSLAPDSQPNSGSSTYVPKALTIPISGKEKTIHVSAQVNGTTATITQVDTKEMQSVIGHQMGEEAITIDFSVLNKPPETVVVPISVAKQIIQAVQNLDENTAPLEIKFSSHTTIRFSTEALNQILEQTKGKEISISIIPIQKVKHLTAEQKKEIGNRPAYDVSVTSGGEYISDLGGEITITIGYQLKKDEKAESLAVYYVDTQCRLEACETAYDAEKQQITFQTNHLSVYLIAYEETPEQTAAAADSANNTTQKTEASDNTTQNAEASAASAVPVVQPAPRSSHLPWIMAGLVSVAAALSVYLFFLLRKKGKYQG